MTRAREYTIEYDRDGYYLAYEGWDLCRTYRFGSYKEAEARRAQWEKEDEEDLAEVARTVAQWEKEDEEAMSDE